MCQFKKIVYAGESDKEYYLKCIKLLNKCNDFIQNSR